MALQYPGYSIPEPGPSPLLALAKGFEDGRNERRDEQAFLAAAGLGQPGQVKQPTGPAQGLDFLRNLFAGPQAVGQTFTPQMSEQERDAMFRSGQTPPNKGGALDYAPSDSYFASIRSAESGGNDAAKNPNSSATGRYQFTEGTWNDLARNYPALGLTADGRTDPAQQERAIRQFTSDNARTLSGAGIAVNPGNLYAAHFLGAGGAQSVLAGQDNAPVSAYVGPEVVQANPFLADMTVGDFKAWAAQKGGGQGGGYAPPGVAGIPQATGPKYTLPDRETMLALFRSPETRDIATALAQGAINGQNAQALQTFERPDGSIWQFNPASGEIGVVQDGLERNYKQAQIDALRAKPATTMTDDQKEYDQAVKQGFKGTLQDWIKGNKAGQTINVNTGEGSDGALNKALSEAEGKQWADYKAAGAVSGANAQDFAVLDELLKIAPQGPIVGRLAETFKGFSSAGDAVQSIVKRIAPTLRAPGSGATSDIEYDGMLRSLPSLGNSPEANAMIASIMKAKAEINVQRSELITQYQNGELTIGEARRKMNELDRVSILTPEMRQALVGIGGTGETQTFTPAVGDVVEGYRFRGGNPADQQNWEKVE